MPNFLTEKLLSLRYYRADAGDEGKRVDGLSLELKN